MRISIIYAEFFYYRVQNIGNIGNIGNNTPVAITAHVSL